jgi:Fic family protein
MRFPATPPPFQLREIDLDTMTKLLAHAAPTLGDGRYLHWDRFRRRPPPDGLTIEQAWFAQKFARIGARVTIPGFVDHQGTPFSFCRVDAIDKATHQLDRRDAARAILETMGDDAARQQYRVDQLIEEAINSSLIEGAKLTTRAEAKAMIRSGLEPGSRGEKMVLNNYNAMKRLLEVVERDLTLDDLLEIHSILGADALDTPNAEGRLRTDAEHIQVVDSTTSDVWFVPPPAHELPARLDAMLSFANDGNSEKFIHPLVRAIVLHFWLAYLHPFADGNGRMARALFYWQMLRTGYDFAQYLSISGPIDRAPRAYYLAFAYVETDGGDLTYFLLNQLAVLNQATEELLEHLRERATRLKRVAAALSSAESLNHRQQAVLSYLVRNPHQGVTIASHVNSHGVSYLTARKDLQDLESQGLLRRVRVGRTDRYLPTEKLAMRLA